MSIKVTGKISLPASAPETLPKNSYMKVSLQDVSIACGPSKKLGESEVSLKNYKKGTPIEYVLECPKPSEIHPFNSVSAVLNVGWKPDPKGDSWCRKGDFVTDTNFAVDLEDNKKDYKVDFHLIEVR